MSRRATLSVALCLSATLASGLVGCGSGGSSNSSSLERVFNGLVGSTVPANGVDFVQRSAVVNLYGPVPFGAFQPNASQPAPSALNGSAYYFTVASAGNGTLGVNGVTTNVYPGGNDGGTPLAPSVSEVLEPHDANTTDGTFTIAVAGVLGSTSAPPQILRYVDNPNIPTGSPDAFVRIINLSPDSGSITLDSTSNGVTQQVNGLQNITYTNASNYVAIPVQGTSQTFNFSVYNGASFYTLKSNLSAVSLSAGHAYTFVLIGAVNPATAPQPLDLAIAQDL